MHPHVGSAPLTSRIRVTCWSPARHLARPVPHHDRWQKETADGRWQSCVWKMVWQRWWVTMWCRGVTGDQRRPSAPRSAISAMPASQNEGGCEIAPHLPRETKVDVTKCHACQAKCRGVTGDQRRPSTPHSAISAAPATQNEGGCEIVPCLATQNEGGCHQVPRLPRKVPRRHRRPMATKRATQCHKCHACHTKRKLCHACHAKRRWMSPSATPATQSAAASPATNGDQVRHTVP